MRIIVQQRDDAEIKIPLLESLSFGYDRAYIAKSDIIQNIKRESLQGLTSV